jgi:methyl-accepting chemotaxis protein/ligand-binding sensor domain-containing protein
MKSTCRVGHRIGHSILRPILVSVCATFLAVLSAERVECQSLQFRHLGPNEGLSGSWVPDILQDGRGFLWFGTANGLTRYDGYTFTIYRYSRTNPNSLGANHVNSLYEDSEGTLWVGTRAGLSRYDGDLDRFTNYMGPGGAATPGARQVHAVLEDSRGTLWVGTTSGLYHFDRVSRRETLYPLPGVPTPTVHVLREDSRKRVWVGTQDEGLFEIDLASGSVTSHKPDSEDVNTLPDHDIRAIVEDGSGTLWVGTYNGGLASLDGQTRRVTRYQHDPRNPNSLARNRILRLITDRERGLWISAENGGLDYFDPATGVFHHNFGDPSNPSGLNSNSIWSLFQDAGGTIWAGTFSGGLNVSRQNSDAVRRFRSIPGDPTSLSTNSVLGFSEDAQGGVWVATDGGGLNRLDLATGRFVSYTTANSNLNSDAVLAVASERAGGVWVGTWGGGISHFDPATQRFRAYTPANSDIPDVNVFSVREDRAGRLWVGTWREGLLRLDRETNTFTTHRISPPGTTQSQIWLIHEMDDGKLALGTTENGLLVFDPDSGSMRSFMSDAEDAETLSSNSVHALLEIEPGVLWVGTAAGIDRLDLASNRTEHLAISEEFPSNLISGLSKDGTGSIWISTDKGISRYDPRTGTIKNYAMADGLQGNEFNPRAYLRMRAGTLLFAGNQGFNAIVPERIANNDRKPTVALTGFQLFNRPVPIGTKDSPLQRHISRTDRLVLTHQQSVFTFEFAALDFTAPEKNLYAYMMEGFDSDWNHVGNVRTASYMGLRPGRYVFRVKASNNDGVWNEEGASIQVTIMPPFWQTWWFRVMVALAALSIIAAVVRNARNRRRRLEAMNAQLGTEIENSKRAEADRIRIANEVAERDRQAQEYLERNVLEILGVMERFSDGDLTARLEVRTEDAIGRLRGGFNRAVENIRNMVVQVNEVLDATVRASRHIHARTEELARGAESQTQQTVLVASATEQMTHTAADTARHISDAAEMAQRSGGDAQNGGRIVRDTVSSMENIVSVVSLSAETVKALGSSSRQIGDITRVITEIADQTNLLALNATIEAARAGEHGKGFAVVAGEVKTLASRTASATKEIARTIEQIQREAKHAVDTMGQVTDQVETGKALVDQAGAALESIIANSQQVLDSIRQVTQASEEQAAATSHISQNVEAIARVTKETAAGNQAITQSVQELTELIADLQARVARFHLEERGTGLAHTRSRAEEPALV